MSKTGNLRPWTRHYGLPQIPIVITDPSALVQIREDGVRGRCRVAPANDVDWERVTQWRWDDTVAAPRDPDEMTLQECDDERRRMDADRAQFGADLLVAKRRQDDDAIRDIGQRLDDLNRRAGHLKSRRHALVTEAAREAKINAYKRAAQEILPPDLLRKLYDRVNMIEQEMRL